MQNARCGHGTENQTARKSDAHQRERRRGRHRDDERHFRQRGEAGWSACTRQRRRHQPEQGEPCWDANGQQQHAHGLYDGDCAQIGAKLRRKCNDLHHGARARAHQRRKRVPAVHGAQIAGSRDDHGHRRNDQKRNAGRPGEEALDGLRRHHRAELNADNDVPDARHRDRHLDGTTEQGSGADRKHRAGNKTSRKS